PWNPERTPGGSSSGSAVAVATRMVPVALGSQTGGSILRPAAFCGIVGLKPTYGRVSRYGVTPSSWSVDHVGPLTRTVEDAALMLQVMAGPDPNDPASAGVPVGDYLSAARKRDRAPVLGLVADYLEPASGVSAEVADHVREVAARFERAGAEVREVRLPMPLATFVGMRHVMNQVETSEEHFRTLAAHPEGYRPKIRAYVEIGQLVAGPVYLHAQRLRRRARPAMEAMLEGVDCLLMPTVDVVAPDTSSTGSSNFQAVWSLFGFPSISLPAGLSKERLPLHIQLAALPFQEETLLSASGWAEDVLGPMPSPV
ncbi:MAG TPA: amidase, partial [Chloroflexota bacterium]|nr:amidase [Chloroflexota bacterium]